MTAFSALARNLARPDAPTSWIITGPGGSGREDFITKALDALAVPQHARHRLVADPGKMLTVESLRQALVALRLTTDGLRVLILPDCDRALGEQAAQLLLKMAEDAPRGVRLLMTAEQPGRLPATLLSRSHKTAAPIQDQTMIEAALMRDGLTQSEASLLFRLCGNSLGRASQLYADGALDILKGMLRMLAQPAPWSRVELQTLADTCKNPLLMARLSLDLVTHAVLQTITNTQQDVSITAYAQRAGMPRLLQADRFLRSVLLDSRELALDPRHACMRLLLCLELPIKGR